jgi:hypothetical protein
VTRGMTRGRFVVWRSDAEMYACMYDMPYECVTNGTCCCDKRDVVFFGEVMHSEVCTAILIIFEGQFQVFPRFSSSKLVLKTD